MRRAAKIDSNQTEIIQALRDMGATVQSLAAVGGGVPDLLVAYRSALFLMEVKDGAKPPSGRKLTQDQVKWIQGWNSPVYIVKSVEEAIGVLG